MFRFSWEKKFKNAHDKINFRFLSYVSLFSDWVFRLFPSVPNGALPRALYHPPWSSTLFFFLLPVQYQTEDQGHWRRRRIHNYKRLEGWLGTRWWIFNSGERLSYELHD